MENAEKNDSSSNMENSKFVEFWVPVQLSNVQLEQYCATLLSKAIALCSSAKGDPFEALKEVFYTNRKCCNHPYIVDFKLQESLIKDKDRSMILDIDIKASGKLHFLNRVLPEIKKQQLRVVILFQPTNGDFPPPGLLVDYVHQRFGQESYEQMNGVGHMSSKKQAAINIFNNDKNRFIFLLESRACHPSLKLSSVDVIIIFDSDLNPHNDLKSLRKISFDSQKSEQIMIFRLYSKSTLEEKILKLAENNMVIDIRPQSPRSNYDAFLTWGASDLFNKLTEFHRQTVVNISSEESLLHDDAVEEFLYIISHKCKSDAAKGVIIQVQNCGKNILLHYQVKAHGDQPNVFWRKLLDGRFPTWKFVSESTSRKRKRPNYFLGYFLDSPRMGKSDAKTRSKTTINPAQLKTVSEGETAGVNEANDESPSSSGDPAVDNEARLHDLLKSTVSELCNMLKFSVRSSTLGPILIRVKMTRLYPQTLLSIFYNLLNNNEEDVKVIVENILEFIFEKYEVGGNHTKALQAFMISLCWMGSSLGKYRIDRSESFALAKKHFNFSCMVKEANFVYKKLEGLKEAFLEYTSSLACLKDSVPVCEEDTCERENVDATASIGEVPAQLQVDDDMEVDVADSSHENAKSIHHAVEKTGASDNMEMPAGDYNKEIGESADMGMAAEKEEAEIWPDRTDVGENQNEISPNDVLAHFEMADNEENTVMRPDVSEDHNDFCGSNSSNPVCAAAAVSSVQPVSSSASDHIDPIIPEIKNETCQLPDSGVQDEIHFRASIAPAPPVDMLIDNLTSRMNPQNPTETDPFQDQVERLYIVRENVTKSHQEMKQNLDYECEKEIAELVAQIRHKYEAKHLEVDVAYNKKYMELETNIKRVIMNKSLADAFRSRCQDLTPSGHPGMQQVSHDGLMQQLNRLSGSPMRHLHGVTSSSLGQSSGSQQPLQPPQPLPQPLQQPQSKLPLQIVHQPADLFSSRSITPFISPGRVHPTSLRHESFTVPPSSQPCTVPSSEPLLQSFDNLTGPIDNAPPRWVDIATPQPDIRAQFDDLNIIDLTQEGTSSSHYPVCLSDDD